jgi:hypothetical protein
MSKPSMITIRSSSAPIGPWPLLIDPLYFGLYCLRSDSDRSPSLVKWYSPIIISGANDWYRSSISSCARAQENESRNVFLKDGFIHDSSLHCYLKPITPSLPSGWKPRSLLAAEFHSKLCDCLQQLFWLVEDPADERSLHLTEKPEVWWCKIRTVRWVRNRSNMIFSDKLFSDL